MSLGENKSTFQKIDNKQDSLLSKGIRKLKNVIEEETDSGDVVELLIEQNQLIRNLNNIQEFKIQNIIETVFTTELNFVDTTFSSPNFIKNISTNSYIHIHKIIFSSNFPITIFLFNIGSGNDGTILSLNTDDNLVVENIRGANLKNIGMNLFSNYPFTALNGNIAGISVQHVIEFRKIV